MDDWITIVCYKNGEIIDGSYGVGYSCPLERGVLVNNTITYDELEDKLCHVMSIDHAHTKLSMVFRHGEYIRRWALGTITLLGIR